MLHKVLLFLYGEALGRRFYEKGRPIYFGTQPHAIVLSRLMYVSLVNVFASEIIVQHEASEEVVAPILHKTDQVFVPIRVRY